MGDIGFFKFFHDEDKQCREYDFGNNYIQQVGSSSDRDFDWTQFWAELQEYSRILKAAYTCYSAPLFAVAMEHPHRGIFNTYLGTPFLPAIHISRAFCWPLKKW